jgi:hypothetical protein
VPNSKTSRIDPEKVTACAAVGLTQREVAAIMGCNVDTIRKHFLDEYNLGKDKAGASVRRKQFEEAMKGNSTMLVWLGKNLLGQSDRMEHTGEGGGPIQAAVSVHFVKSPNQG